MHTRVVPDYLQFAQSRFFSASVPSLCTMVLTLWGAGVQVVAVAAGATHSVLSTSTGLVYTFGASCSGQCGHGDTDPVPYPRRVEGLAKVSSPLRCPLFSFCSLFTTCPRCPLSVSSLVFAVSALLIVHFRRKWLLSQPHATLAQARSVWS